MKKKKAVRVKRVSSPKKSKYTAGVVLFVVFLIAIVGAIVFVAINNNPAKTPHAAGTQLLPTGSGGGYPPNSCDFNADGKVDNTDLNIAAKYYGTVNANTTQYDVNRDGRINSLDLQIIATNNTKYCISSALNSCDFNADGKVDNTDVNMAAKYFGAVNTISTQYDVNRDGRINSLDLQIIATNNPKYCISNTKI